MRPYPDIRTVVILVWLSALNMVPLRAEGPPISLYSLPSFPSARSGMNATVRQGGTLYYTSLENQTAYTLRKMNLATGESQFILDLPKGAAVGEYGSALVELPNGRLLFLARDAATGVEPWTTDGTEQGTTLVKDILPGPIGSGESDFRPFQNLLVPFTAGRFFFAATDGVNGIELWITDGTSAGTRMVADLCPGSCNSSPGEEVVVNGVAYFRAYESATATKTSLWRTDGTTAGTFVLMSQVNPTDLTAAGNRLFFSGEATATGRELYVSSGTAATTKLVKDICSGTCTGVQQPLAGFGNDLLFAGITTANGVELWKSDGTAVGTVLVKDIYPGAPGGLGLFSGSGSHWIRVFGSVAYLAAADPNFGMEMWQTDGTSAGTIIVRDINPGVGDSFPGRPLLHQGVLLFAADSPGFGYELWRSTGAAGITELVKDIYVGATSSNVNLRFQTADGVYLTASSGDHPIGLWRSDGTSAGTQFVGATEVALNDRRLDGLTSLADQSLFIAGSSLYGTELWKTDGTPSGTAIVKDIRPGASGGIALDLQIMAGASVAYFIGNDGITGDELWTTDLSEAGTHLVADLVPGPAGSQITFGATIGNTFYFAANNALYRTDGTAGSTLLLRTFAANPVRYAVLGSILLFGANDGVIGDELWRTDGTVAGTVLVKDVAPGQTSSLRGTFAVVGNSMMFTAFNGPTGAELWKTDGTTAGTVLAADICPGQCSTSIEANYVGGSFLFFYAKSTDGGWEPWVSNGTQAGTVALGDLNPGVTDSLPRSAFPRAVSIGNKTLFISEDDRNAPDGAGTALWVTDGSVAGTHVVKDFWPGPGRAMLRFGGAAHGRVYLLANDGPHGDELWSTDGTPAGTRLVRDLAPGSAASFYYVEDMMPSFAAAAGDRLIFFGSPAATLEPYGEHVWSLTPCHVQQPTWYRDADGDGFGSAAVTANSCDPGFVANALDCDDSTAAINPNATESCNALDDNCNLLIDDGIPAPDPATGLAFVSNSKQQLNWPIQLDATSYDVVRGDLRGLISTAGNFTSSLQVCLANNLLGTSVNDPVTPAVNQGSYYLYRSVGCGALLGSYDDPLGGGEVGSRDAEIAAAPTACP